MLEALEDRRLPEQLRRALKEWWEWYDVRYAMPIEISVESGVVRVTIFYDIEEELRRCEEACVKEAEKELNIEWEEAKEKIWHGCHEGCTEDIVRDLYTDVGIVTNMLDKVLKKYGIKSKVEYGWDNYTYWARYEIELD